MRRMEATTLFLGGNLDGRRIAVPESLQDFINHYAETGEYSERSDGEVKTELYHRMKLAAGDRIFYVFKHRELTAEEAFERLLQNYSSAGNAVPERDPNCPTFGRDEQNRPVEEHDPNRKAVLEFEE
jgi:hypothetical protein